MQSSRPSSEPPDRVACARCGATFECCARTATPCWCVALPPIADIDINLKGCMCPACLNAMLAQQGTT